jgi:uncharacterized protein with PIN domain
MSARERTVTPDTRLLVDAMCGSLARYLRICGYDAAYAPDRGVEADEAVARLARAEGRRLVTRDRALADTVEGAVLLAERDVADQLRELRGAGFALAPTEPTRCGRCNGRLVAVAAGEPTPEYAPDTDEQPVWRCPDCGQHFWKGSHWADVADRLDAL